MATPLFFAAFFTAAFFTATGFTAVLGTVALLPSIGGVRAVASGASCEVGTVIVFASTGAVGSAAKADSIDATPNVRASTVRATELFRITEACEEYMSFFILIYFLCV